MKQKILILWLLFFTMPTWAGGISNYCKKEGKPIPEQINGIYFYCGGSIESCSDVKSDKYKKIFKSFYEHAPDNSAYEHSYLLVLPDTLTSKDEDRVMIYGELAIAYSVTMSLTTTRYGSFQNTFNEEDFVCGKAKGLLCKYGGSMTSEFYTEDIIKINTDADCTGHGPLTPTGFWKKVER